MQWQRYDPEWMGLGVKVKERVAVSKTYSSIARQASANAASERSRVFRFRARELGGINARTRPIIEQEADTAARLAAEAVYLAAGYTRCEAVVGATYYAEENQHMPEMCERLATPGYAFCPTHAPVESRTVMPVHSVWASGAGESLL